jgi:hypothetical protein
MFESISIPQCDYVYAPGNPDTDDDIYYDVVLELQTRYGVDETPFTSVELIAGAE